jgi:hypothetical protein
LICAVEAIQAGTDVTLVCGAEVQNTVSAREGTLAALAVSVHVVDGFQ